MPLLDVFSRFHWLHSLQPKHSPGVKEFMKKIYNVYGTPGTLQSEMEKNLKEILKGSFRKRKLKWYKAGHTTQEHKERLNVRTVSLE